MITVSPFFQVCTGGVIMRVILSGYIESLIVEDEGGVINLYIGIL